MRNNGVSLIVLVITIIIMIILASTIIISLNNTGIIGAAEQAVCKTNIKQAENIAVLKWAELYTLGEKNTEKIKGEIIKELSKNNIDKDSYELNVTTGGVEITVKDGCIDVSKTEGGKGTESDPYLILTVEQLKNVKNELGAHYRLGKDLDLSVVDNWEPIGTEEAYFTGSFDGQGYTIKNIKINTEEEKQGLFGCVTGTIKNTTLTGEMTTDAGVIGMIGKLHGGTVENCVNYANVTTKEIDTITGAAGGVEGFVGGGTVSNCVNYGKITGASNCIGGVAGSNTGLVTNCTNYGEVIADEKTGTYRSAAGGVVGYNWDDGDVEYCINMATVKSNFFKVAGIVGDNHQGNVRYSYNVGDIINTEIDDGSEEATDNRFGGIAGKNRPGCIVSDCYNTGNVSAIGNVAGIVALNEGTVTNTYNIGSVTGVSNVGGVVGSLTEKNEDFGSVENSYYLDTCVTNGTALGTSKTMTEMKTSTFANLLGTNWKWDINKNNGYPVLSWQ